MNSVAIRTSFFVNMLLKIFPEILQGALQGFHRSRGQGTERVSRYQCTGMKGEHLKVIFMAFAVLERQQYFFGPGQALPEWCTPPAGFLGEATLQVVHKAHRTDDVIQHDKGPWTQPADSSSH